MSSNTVERDWTTEAGLRAACLLVNDGRNRCGYVAIPKDHPLHGVEYSQHSDSLIGVKAETDAGPIGKRGIISVLCHRDREATPDYVFDVHGSITYSAAGQDDYPAKSSPDEWWFGFDCAHCDDTLETCTEQFVVAECEQLATALVAVEAREKEAVAIRRRALDKLSAKELHALGLVHAAPKGTEKD